MSILHVVFELAGVEYAIPAAEVVQMESFGGATRVPGAAPHIAGVIQVRGRVVPLLDLRRRFGLSPAEPTLDTRVIVVDLGGRALGLLVDRAREVLKLETEQIRPAPDLVAGSAEGVIRAVAHVDRRLLLLIELQRLVAEEGSDAEKRA